MTIVPIKVHIQGCRKIKDVYVPLALVFVPPDLKDLVCQGGDTSVLRSSSSVKIPSQELSKKSGQVKGQTVMKRSSRSRINQLQKVPQLILTQWTEFYRREIKFLP